MTDMKLFFTTALRYLRILLGAAIYAFGFAFFIYPAGLVTGGFIGIATVVNYATGFSIGIMVLCVNIPLFLLGGFSRGWKFLIASAVGMASQSLLIDAFKLFSVQLTDNPLLAALYGGILLGCGLGIVFGAGATTGGTDIIAMLLRPHYPGLNISQLMLCLNICVLGVYVATFGDIEKIMYSAIAIFLSSRVMDGVLYGVNYGKLAYVISDRAEEIARDITVQLKRGVTKLYGQGEYSGAQKTVLLCAIKRRQILELKRIVKQEDPHAFVILTETREVLGKGFEHYEV